MLYGVAQKNQRYAYSAIATFVVLCHAALLFSLIHSSQAANKNILPKRRVVVQTVKLKPTLQLDQEVKQPFVNVATPPASIPSHNFNAEDSAHKDESKVAKETKAPENKPSEVAVKSKPKVQKIANLNPEKTKEQVATKPQVKQSTPKKAAKAIEKPVAKQNTASDKALADSAKKRQGLLAHASAAIKKVQSVTPQGDSKADISQHALELLPVASTDQAPDPFSANDAAIALSYAEEIAALLKFYLHLPEYGEVDIALTLTAAGKVAHLAIVKSQNKANSKYVQSNIKDIDFPPFGKNFPGEREHIFSIKLSMETL